MARFGHQGTYRADIQSGIPTARATPEDAIIVFGGLIGQEPDTVKRAWAVAFATLQGAEGHVILHEGTALCGSSTVSAAFSNCNMAWEHSEKRGQHP
jgi:hypothetical protein